MNPLTVHQCFNGKKSLPGTGAVDVVGFNPTQANGDLFGNLVTLSGNINGGGTLAKFGLGNLDLTGTNTYTGGTVVDQGILRFSTTASVPASGKITVNSGGTVGTGFAINQAFLNQITSTSNGVVALGADSSQPLDFTNFPNLALGALGHNIFSGTLTPGSNGYQLGGGGYNSIYGAQGNNSVLFIANANTITGNASVTVSPHGTAGGSVVFDDTQDFSGPLTVSGGINAATVSAGLFPGSNITVTSGNLNALLAASTLVLAGGSNGTLPNVSSITLNPLGALELIATPSPANRLPDGAAINFNGGSLAFMNDSANEATATVASYSETVGQMNLQRGYSEVFTNTAQTGQTSLLTFSGTLNYTAGATVLFAGTNLGTLQNKVVIGGSGTSTIATPWAFIGGGSALYNGDTATDFAIISSGTGVKGAAATATTLTAGSQFTSATGTTDFTTSATGNLGLTVSGSANTIRSTGGNLTIDPTGSFTLSVNGILNTSGGSNLNIGTTAGVGSLTAVAGTQQIVFNSATANSSNTGSNIVVNSNIIDNGTGAVTVVKTGLANLTLSGTANTFTGGIVVDGLGALTAANTSVFGSLTGTFNTGNISLNSGTLQINSITAGTVISNNWIVNNDAVIQDNSSNSYSLTGSMTLNGGTLYWASTINAASKSINGAISGSGNLTLQGGSTGNAIVIGGSANNTMTGLTSITGRVDGFYGTQVSLEKTGTSTAISGNIILGESSAGATQAQVQEILILNKNNVVGYNNDIGTVGSQGQIADASVITFQGGNGYDAGVFQLNNQSETIGGVQSASAGDGLIQNNSNTAGTSTLNLNTATGTNYSFSGLVQNHDNSNSNVGVLAISKTGSGTQTFTNANTYTGGTTINAGSFYANNVAGSATGTGSLTVASGATFGGTGIINSISDNNFNAGSTVLVGQANAIDTNTTKVLALNAANADNFNGANLVFNLSTISAGLVGQGDKITTGITSAVNFNGFNSNTFSFNVLGAGTIGNGTQFTLFSSATYAFTPNNSVFGGDIVVSGANNQISGINLNFINAPSTYGASYLVLVDTSGGSMTSFDIDLVIGTAVPEPGTWAMMLGGLALLLVYHRARRKNS